MSTPSAKPADQDNGRNANGQFGAGNSFARQNPYGRRTAEIREAILKSATQDVIVKLLAKLLELAMAGNVPAAKLYLSYAVGKPLATPSPDRVEADEWSLIKDQTVPFAEMQHIVTQMPAAQANIITPTVQMSSFATIWNGADERRAQREKLKEEVDRLHAPKARVATPASAPDRASAATPACPVSAAEASVNHGETPTATTANHGKPTTVATAIHGEYPTLEEILAQDADYGKIPSRNGSGQPRGD